MEEKLTKDTANSETSKIHPWVYVIIPVENTFNTNSVALFTAFCKDCRYYYSESIPYTGEPMLSRSSLPKYGCKPDDEFKPGVGFSTLPGIEV